MLLSKFIVLSKLTLSKLPEQHKFEQSKIKRQNVKIQLPKSLPQAPYNSSIQGEVILTSLTITDDTLKTELPDGLKKEVATSYYIFGVVLPIVIGMKEKHASIPLRVFTNSTKKITFVFGTSSSFITQVDSIEEANDGTVTIRLGDDVMTYQVQDDAVKYNGDTKVGKDFDKLAGKEIIVNNYPLPFDWGCELLGSEISFCQHLDEYHCEIAKFGGDVCTVTSTSLSKRSPTIMKIVNMTGIFREMIPFLAETVPVIRIANGSQRKLLPNLRRFKVKGAAGRFVAERDKLEREVYNRKQQDAVCGKDVKIQLPTFLPHVPYNVSLQGEVALTSVTLTDDTLATELHDDLKEDVATSYYIIGVVLPIVIGMKEKHAAMPLRVFTNSTKKITFVFGTSSSFITQVDSIEEANDGTVTIRLGDDVMTYQVQDDAVKYNGDTKVGKDFDKLAGKEMIVNNYPLSFDWGCELFGSNISFCQHLDEYRCEIAKFGGDVCTVTSTTLSKQSPAIMKIVQMTGIFREMIPFLAETVPGESFEAELVDKEHTTGISYPCLTL
ncbi:hypothetical protein HOLleu_17440 [Holothuria leucospilota]|uniref:Uncharacterized protein n=1 Tax=Holothuria leucospilota TaxID=206669 RepID=A0A9Q1C2H9_HOLLE|nr:hypothetical protein HOLleu_17440 [Holothuria leucospilota]